MSSDENAPLIVREQERLKPRLPVKQLSVLVICRLAEPMCLTSILSYLPQMIRSFGVPEADVGFWVGITASSFSVAQMMTGILWGRLSDRVGRKPVILSGIIGMLTSVVVFGFSSSIAMAMISRLCIGLLNGNVGILRTVVAELVPERELQPQAFSLLPLTWSIGSIAGPIIGGFLSEPAKKYPILFPKDSFFDHHPFALPNLFTAAILFSAFVFGALFLDETLVGQRHRYDPGREVGKKIESCLSSFFSCLRSSEDEDGKDDTHKSSAIRSADEETTLLSPPPNTYSTMPPPSTQPKTHQPSTPHHTHPNTPLPWNQVLTRQSVYNILVYFLIAIHVVSYDSILPVFLSSSPPNSENPIHLPHHIPGGFGLNTSQIGLIYSVHAIITMLLQFYMYPPIARSYGSVKLLVWSACMFPLVYLLTPYTLAIPSARWTYAVWTVIVLIKSITGVFAFTSSTILITNTASSIRVLGTLNGFATSVAAMGRTVGPSTFGWLFSIGQKGDVTIIPWVGLTVVSALMWIWLPKLVEGKGLEGEESSESDSEEDEDMTTVIFVEPTIDEIDGENRRSRRDSTAKVARTRRLSMGSVNEQ
ncbi:hypothetical protein H072_11611 [Dactylellina haptotyla CBS 200.50]|uniref:Major facilitator superfamily (MFS) profile domain-containing protein n=1 Tax=Dactylellina haptotyla (strain CBS 200.50) TaxID=1284197 RepID=S8A253_DACHA|nr:hypothetical protein H072_11611 [Dactylellina haptotyla CBS 200.50]